MPDAGPVIVIGAGRSGTNLLRDILCRFDGLDTWPCDEINYVWRHGNRGAPTDELHPGDARPEVVAYIRRAFAEQQRRSGGQAVVEKTCANSLRVGFVDAVCPDARFVHIVRDGRDVVASAMARWTAPLDVGYVARKARFVPRTDLPYYALRYARARLRKLRSSERRLGSWGPRFAGMDELLQHATLAEVCARQWQRCVERSVEQLGVLDDARVLRVRYEQLTAEPVSTVHRLAEFVARAAPPAAALPRISVSSVGRWRSALSAADQQTVERIVGPTLAAHGYAA